MELKDSISPSAMKKQKVKNYFSLSMFSILIAVSSLFISLSDRLLNVEVSHLKALEFEKMNNHLLELSRDYLSLKTKVDNIPIKDNLSAIEALHKNIESLQKNYQQIIPLSDIKYLGIEISNLLELSKNTLFILNDPIKANELLKLIENKLTHSFSLQVEKLDLLKNSVNHLSYSLQAINFPNIERIITQMDSLMNRLENLPVKTYGKDDSNDTTLITNKNSNSETLVGALEKFKSIIKIRKHDKAVEPILDTQEQTLLELQCRLLIEQAKMAVLMRNSSMMAINLQSINNILTQHFDGDNLKIKNIKSELDSLSTINLSPKLIEIENSYRDLTNILQGFNL
ncbi:MAG: hypothetical protein JWM09_1428 [Francisellaceae bacterium]|nr:hypothetical protein [Francisellaceae bacterium]